MSETHLPSIQFRLLSPLVGALLGFTALFAYFSWNFHLEYAELKKNIFINSDVTRHVIEVMRQRARTQEVLLLFRFNGDASYATELDSLNTNRSAHLERIQWHTGQRPELRSLSSSLVGGLNESSYLQSEMVQAVQAGNFARADEAFRQLSTIFEINSARIKDFSRSLENELSDNEHAMEELIAQIFWTLAMAVGLFACAIGLIALFYRRGVLRPLQMLHRGLQSLARDRKHSQLPQVAAPRELHEMIVDFNQMAQAIDTSHTQLLNAREEALRAARIKSDFLSNMSHEIRTPMNAIIGMADLLAGDEMPTEKKRYLKILRNSGQVLLNVVNDILDYSRLESGAVTLDHEPFELGELVHRVSEVVDVMAQKKRLAFACTVSPPEPRWLLGDAKRVEQIILNLLGNAVKFTDSGRVDFHVETTVNKTVCSTTFRVTDTGIGMAPGDLSRLFNRFTQSDSSITRRYGGTGLGLAIVKQLVELMKGRVAVKSEVGKGSEFCVFLTSPLAEAPRQAEEPLVIATGKSDTLGKILIVDDSPDNRLLIQAYLNGLPCEITTAANGEEAVGQFERDCFNVILMDMQMPVLDGYAATAHIRELERTQRRKPTPIIALTAYAMPAEIKRSLEAGCDAHLTKPVRRDDLLRALGQVRTRSIPRTPSPDLALHP